MDIVLASGSASRRAILEEAGVPFRIVWPEVDEDLLKKELPDLSPQDVAVRLAEAKALSIGAQGALVIGADQVLEFEGQAYDKPKSRQELFERLRAMSGKPHFLRGGVVLAKDGTVIETIKETSTLWMRELKDSDIVSYLDAAGEEVLGTVGGYMLEGKGARLFSRVEGDFFSILGMPLFPVLEVLRREGALSW